MDTSIISLMKYIADLFIRIESNYFIINYGNRWIMTNWHNLTSSRKLVNKKLIWYIVPVFIISNVRAGMYGWSVALYKFTIRHNYAILGVPVTAPTLVLAFTSPTLSLLLFCCLQSTITLSAWVLYYAWKTDRRQRGISYSTFWVDVRHYQA